MHAFKSKFLQPLLWAVPATLLLIGCEPFGSGDSSPEGSHSPNAAIIQYQVQDPDGVGVDADRLSGMIEQAATQGAKLVVTPETAFYRYSPYEQNGVTMVDLANAHGELESRFSALAAQLQIYLVIGFREPTGTNTLNTAVLYGPDGHALARHHKLIPSLDEVAYTVPGREITVVDTKIGRIGLAICKDVHSPELRQAYVDAGINLFLLPAADRDGKSLSQISDVCAGAGCYGVLANQQIHDGNSGWVTPDGSIDSVGDGEKISFGYLPLLDATTPAAATPELASHGRPATTHTAGDASTRARSAATSCCSAATVASSAASRSSRDAAAGATAGATATGALDAPAVTSPHSRCA